MGDGDRGFRGGRREEPGRGARGPGPAPGRGGGRGGDRKFSWKRDDGGNNNSSTSNVASGSDDTSRWEEATMGKQTAEGGIWVPKSQGSSGSVAASEQEKVRGGALVGGLEEILTDGDAPRRHRRVLLPVPTRPQILTPTILHPRGLQIQRRGSRSNREQDDDGEHRKGTGASDPTFFDNTVANDGEHRKGTSTPTLVMD
ncbi:hypothetical protein ZWY2020_002092 [Hordeum vulgare]|nr:hypothetical protein ZWY2020_002092 [Hordeum vulgare]